MKRRSRSAETTTTVALIKETTMDPDWALVEECRLGSARAFDTLVKRYKDRVYNVAYRFVGNHEDAQDIAQEAFIRAYKGIEAFKGTSKVYTWLYSITGNLARNKLRDANRKGRNMGSSLEALQEKAPDVAQAYASTTETPEQIARGRELEEQLQVCLDEMPEHCRMTFVLRTFENLTYAEIADCMACPTGTVKSRLNQARSMLHTRLKELSLL